MEVYKEDLYHFTCDHCKLVWTISDRKVTAGVSVICPSPNCGKTSQIELIKSSPLEPLLDYHPPPKSNGITTQ